MSGLPVSEVPTVSFTVNGVDVTVPAEGTLLTALRERLPEGMGRLVSVKDGCAPQGQCGCCTVWVDGEPRVACVTPVVRVGGRSITTLEGMDELVRSSWSEALCATGGSQCGFCTPGIIMRLAAHVTASQELSSHGNTSHEDSVHDSVNKSLLAHLCRCTGWQTIHEAVEIVTGSRRGPEHRDFSAASRRADLEGHSHQTVHPRISLGDGGFAEDIAPRDALVAVLSPTGEWVLGLDTASARRSAGAVQGRKSTVPLTWPVRLGGDGHESSIIVPSGDWVRTLTTTWVEPAYLEPDAVWCTPGGEPVGPLVNGGAFGGKSDHRFVDEMRSEARRLADENGRPVRVVLSREDVVRRGPKRPPMALAVRADGSGTMRAARTPGLADLVAGYAPDWTVIEVDVPGPPTSLRLRGAGWAEIAIARSSVGIHDPGHEPGEQPGGRFTDGVRSPDGARAWAGVEWVQTAEPDGNVSGRRQRIVTRVQCGPILDETVLRSYCIGAAHMALGWVRSEGIAVDGDGIPVDLTMRSFGVLRAVDTPEVVVDMDTRVHDTGIVPTQPVNGSDAVFAAVAAAVWRNDGFPALWPTTRVP